jgi:hypothetical protein
MLARATDLQECKAHWTGWARLPPSREPRGYLALPAQREPRPPYKRITYLKINKHAPAKMTYARVRQNNGFGDVEAKQKYERHDRCAYRSLCQHGSGYSIRTDAAELALRARMYRRGYAAADNRRYAHTLAPLGDAPGLPCHKAWLADSVLFAVGEHSVCGCER